MSMTHEIQYDPAMVKSAMDLIASGAGDGYLECTEEEMRLLRIDRFWTAREKFTVLSGMQKTLQGSLTAAGYPALDVPAEFVAAGIALLVRPVNQLAAATIMGEGLIGVEEAMQGGQYTDAQIVSPRALFAMVMKGRLWDHHFQTKMMQRLDVKLKMLEEAGRPTEKEPV